MVEIIEANATVMTIETNSHDKTRMALTKDTAKWKSRVCHGR